VENTEDRGDVATFASWVVSSIDRFCHERDSRRGRACIALF